VIIAITSKTNRKVGLVRSVSVSSMSENKPRIGPRVCVMRITLVVLAVLYFVLTISTTKQMTRLTLSSSSPEAAATGFLSVSNAIKNHQFLSGWSISSSLTEPASSPLGRSSKMHVVSNDIIVDPEATSSAGTKTDGGTSSPKVQVTKSTDIKPQAKDERNGKQSTADSVRTSTPPPPLPQQNNARSRILRNFNASAINPRQMHEELHSFYTQNGTLPILSPHKRWNDPDLLQRGVIPQWVSDYFNWHEYKRRYHFNEDNFENERWLVMQCLTSNRKCGGTSDRLKPIAYILRAAYYSKRILLIHWTRPCSLEEFLVPPKLGFDWRLKSRWLCDIIEKKLEIGGDEYAPERVLKAALNPDKPLVRSRMQDYHGGYHWYDGQLVEGEPSFLQVFHELWKIFFTPSLAVQTRIESAMKDMNLTPYKYTAAHCRVLYAMDDREEEVKKNWAENAINCASELRPQTPIFFVSDSANATYYARQYGEHHNRPVRIATRVPDPNPPVHIDMQWKGRPLSHFYDGFVDLYILASADCVTYNKGGFGMMGLLMGRNATCQLRQDAINRPVISHPCHWTDDPTDTTSENTRSHYVPPEIKESSPLWREWYNNPVYLEAVDS